MPCLLNYAIAKNATTQKIKELVEQGYSLHTKDGLGNTPLHTAVRYNRLDLIEYFLHEGAFTEEYNYHGNTPLCLAAMGGNLVSLDLLLKNGALSQPSCYDNSPLMLAAKYGQLKATQRLLEAEKTTNTTEFPPPLFEAAKKKQGTTFKNLCIAGADVNCSYKNETLVAYFAKNRTAYELASLFYYGAKCEFVRTDRTYKNSHIFFRLIDSNDTEVLHHFFRHLPSLADMKNDQGETPLLYAIRTRVPYPTIQVILKHTKKMHSERKGNTALHLAARNADLLTVALLRKRGFLDTVQNHDKQLASIYLLDKITDKTLGTCAHISALLQKEISEVHKSTVNSAIRSEIERMKRRGITLSEDDFLI